MPNVRRNIQWVRAVLRVTSVASLLALAGANAGQAAQEVCAAGTTRISQLGTRSSFSPRPVDTWEELSSFFARDSVQQEVAAMLSGTEWEELLLPLSKALASREGWSDETWSVTWKQDVDLVPGSAVEWMVFRGRQSGRALLGSGPFCMATARPYPSWGLEVVKTEETKCVSTKRTTWELVIPEACANLALVDKRERTEPYPVPPGAQCSLAVERSCEEGVFRVDASGSSREVQVTSGGRRVDLSRDLRGQLADPDPFAAAEFVARVEIADECAKPRSCSRTFMVPAEERPECSISAPEKAPAGKPFQVEMSGRWQRAEVLVTDEEGETVTTLAGPFPVDLTLARPGTYTLTGAAATRCGKETCSTTVEIAKRRWTLRGYPLFFLGDDESRQVRTTRLNDEDQLLETFDVSADSGSGLGLSAEYRLSDRLGVEVGLLAADIDTDFRAEQALLWGGQELYNEVALVDEDLSLEAITVGLNFHLTPRRAMDLYAGPLAGYARLDGRYALRFLPQDDLTQNRTLERSSSEMLWGGQVGLDIPLGKKSRWALHLGAMVLDLTSEGPGGEIEIGPLIARGGLAYRN